jgi:hypothetical protein
VKIDLETPQPVSAEVLVTMSDGSTVKVNFPEGTRLDIVLTDKTEYDDGDWIRWDPGYRRVPLDRKVKLTIESQANGNKANGVLANYVLKGATS